VDAYSGLTFQTRRQIEQIWGRMALVLPKVCQVLLACSIGAATIGLSLLGLANHFLRCNIAVAKWLDLALMTRPASSTAI
jgi:hypothetical protein